MRTKVINTGKVTYSLKLSRWGWYHLRVIRNDGAFLLHKPYACKINALRSFWERFKTQGAIR